MRVRHVHGLTWERFHDVLTGENIAEHHRQDARRIARAMRLLKVLLRAGCERRGEI